MGIKKEGKGLQLEDLTGSLMIDVTQKTEERDMVLKSMMIEGTDQEVTREKKIIKIDLGKMLLVMYMVRKKGREIIAGTIEIIKETEVIKILQGMGEKEEEIKSPLIVTSKESAEVEIGPKTSKKTNLEVMKERKIKLRTEEGTAKSLNLANVTKSSEIKEMKKIGEMINLTRSLTEMKES